MAKSIREKIKECYIQGMDIGDICTTYNISRANFYYHKNADLKKGINWDILALSVSKDEQDIKDKEAMFLSTLISSFEKYIQKLQDEEQSSLAIEKLHRYASTYWKLKAPKNDDFSCAKATIEQISAIALEENNTIVCEFLSKNAEKIINKVFKGKK